MVHVYYYSSKSPSKATLKDLNVWTLDVRMVIIVVILVTFSDVLRTHKIFEAVKTNKDNFSR